MSALPPAPSGPRIGRIIGIVLLACVALCGIVGSCLLVLNLVLTPLMVQ
jgi:hypothetical protein